MEILMTGATGFLGARLSSHLESLGHRMTRLGSRNCDLTRPDSLHAFDDRRYDHVYHLAAWTQAGDFCLHHPGEQWLINQKINTHVLSWWQERQPQAKLIAMGTSCAYPCDRELAEENYLEGRPIEGLYTYAMTKRMLYVGMQVLSRQFGLRHLCLVPSTLYGPGYHTDGRQMHFIFDLIRKILRARRDGSYATLWGDGHQSRELVHVDDFVAAAAHLAGTVDDTLVNIGAGEEHSIREFAGLICEITGIEFDRVRFDTTKYVGAKSKCLSVGRLRELMPGLRMLPLRDGLAQTIRWFEGHRELLDDRPSAAA